MNADSGCSCVAVQLARRFSVSSDFEPGSAVKTAIVRPGLAARAHGLVGQLEIADERVMDALDAGVVDADVVRRPECPERLASRRQLAGEV